MASVLPDADYWAALRRAATGYVDLLTQVDQGQVQALDRWEDEGGALGAYFD